MLTPLVHRPFLIHWSHGHGYDRFRFLFLPLLQWCRLVRPFCYAHIDAATHDHLQSIRHWWLTPLQWLHRYVILFVSSSKDSSNKLTPLDSIRHLPYHQEAQSRRVHHGSYLALPRLDQSLPFHSESVEQRQPRLNVTRFHFPQFYRLSFFPMY